MNIRSGWVGTCGRDTNVLTGTLGEGPGRNERELYDTWFAIRNT